MGLARTLYGALFRRTSTFAATIIVGAIVFERIFDEGTEKLWDRMNQGLEVLRKRLKLRDILILFRKLEMLELDVNPQKSVSSGSWEFALGMPLPLALNLLKEKFSRDIAIAFNKKYPLDDDIDIDLAEHGISLKFDSVTQRLKLIMVYDLRRIILKYFNSEFSFPDVPTTYSAIESTFGAVYKKPVLDSKQKFLLLSWPGITFAFSMPVPTPQSAAMSLPPQITGDMEEEYKTKIVLKRVMLYCGGSCQKAEVPEVPPSCCHGNCFAEQVQVEKEGDYVTKTTVLLKSEVGQRRGASDRMVHKEVVLCFGGSVQDVLSSLGAPAKVFYKDVDKMRIHLKDKHKKLVSQHSDYFFNYFTLGMDVLFDAVTHCAKKFVLHTNYPGHYNFGMYHRCDFVITLRDEDDKTIRLTPSTKWSELHLGQTEEEPYYLKRNPSTNVVNPFGSSQCFGSGNLIFEVMENGYIASVTIFSPYLNN